MELRLEVKRLSDALSGILHVTMENIRNGGEVISKVMEVDAKRNAPWTDRTGNARRTLTGFSIERLGAVYIGVMGKMSYSRDLEFKYSRRYAILGPTVVKYAPHMVEIIRTMVAQQEGLRLE